MAAAASIRRACLAGGLVALALIVLAIGGCTGKATSKPSGASGREPVALAPASATGALGLDLVRAQARGNLVLSPASIAAALAMAGTGAAGRTAAQIAEVLHLTSPRAFAAVGRLQDAIARQVRAAGHGDPQAPTLEEANGLFLQRGFQPAASFLGGLREHFAGSAPQAVDFRQASAVEAINAWVSDHTHGVIPHVLSSLPPETAMALANAIYLKATWLHPFKHAATTPARFHGERESASIPFMHETEQLRYGRGRGYAAVDLPYLHSTLSLLVVLPVSQSVASLARRLDAGRLAAIVRGLSAKPVLLSLPRFHLATHTLLNGTLEALGMTDAFSEGAADFSRITNSQPLKIGAVDHAADFAVDEQGTVAAAATIVTIEATAAPVPVARPIPFDANRPFMFFLRDDRSGVVLFAGRLSDPASARPSP